MKVPLPPKANRKLGQNFLVDQNIVQKVVQFIQPSSTDSIIEIGAGTGALTGLLAGAAQHLIAVETDASLLPYLEKIPNVRILHSDIRKVELCSLLPGARVRIVGNLPYYISTAILTGLISQRSCIQDMVLMFQEEVAQRIIAPPSSHEYGLLSVVSQYYCEIRRGFRISRNSFVPKPDIESRILHFLIRSGTMLPYSEFASFLAKAFSQRRKKLRNNLLRTLQIEPARLDAVFTELRIPESARAENLSAEQFEQLMLRV